jgi:hypothetical protein
VWLFAYSGDFLDTNTFLTRYAGRLTAAMKTAIPLAVAGQWVQLLDGGIGVPEIATFYDTTKSLVPFVQQIPV